MTLLPGTRVSRYEIRSLLGKGGMGEVYLAQDTKLDRKVALKILGDDIASDKNRMNRFVQEARAASALNHPNIITIHEIDETDVGQVIATEYIDGETLREHMRASLSLNQILDIASQIANALAASHSTGIVHRDIKPENVMVRHDGIVKVLDFGLAKLNEQTLSQPIDSEALTRAVVNTDSGVVMGTAIYMSPEQARGLRLDDRTDIYSLGVVLYEMITNHLPFEGANSNEILSSLLSEREPHPLARYSSDIPTELDRIVRKALRKNRDERYQTVKDLLLDLKSLKQELDFEKKIEHTSLPPNDGSSLRKPTQPTASVSPPSTIGEEQSHTDATSITSGPIGRIAQHKLAIAFLFSVLVISLAVAYWSLLHHQRTTASIESIAVMPFENTTHDQSVDYLSDGVTESLINSLSQLPQIKVIARNSVFSYKNQPINLQQVAQQLNVQAVLTGRVLMKGDTLDVRIELTNAASNTQLWGDHYVRKVADIFAVQDEIARQVTDTLSVRLTGTQRGQVTKRYTENPEAYNLYLQGRYYMNQFVGENLTKSIPFFDKAIAIDPNYALAYAARGETYFNLGDLSLRMSEARLKAKQDTETALKLDDKLVEAQTTLAILKFQYDWDFSGAEQDFKQAIAFNSNYAEAHHQYAWYLAMVGRETESLAEMKLAQQLDPVNPAITVDVNLPYFLDRQYDECIQLSRKAIDTFPNFFLPHMTLGTALLVKGDNAEALRELEKAEELEPTPHLKGILAYAYARSSRKDEARKLLQELMEQSKVRYVAPYWIAMIHAALDERNEAFEWFEKAYQERSWWLMFLKMDPLSDSLRSDPRFTDLIRRIGFPQ